MGRQFLDLLERHGYDFFTGVPCSLIADLIAVLERGSRAPYVAAAREDAAVGVAAGAWFGGKAPVVLMQNSGLGTSLNALASLSLMYGLPALLVVTWRGFEGKDAPEHILTGEITPKLLELLRIPFRVLAADSLDADVDWAAREMRARSQPVALVVPPKVVEAGQTPAGTPQAARDPDQEGVPSGPRGPSQRLAPTAMSRLTALGIALKAIGEAPVLHANGYICRESFSVADRPQSFYMIGSMGLAPAIALGLALARPARRTVVFDGDGNLLMNLGILPMIAAQRPPGLLHLVFDNEVYGSTGNQASPSRAVGLHRIARAEGYERSVAVAGADEIRDAVTTALRGGGPSFILARVTAEEQPAPRIPYPPEEIRDRFRASFGSERW